MAFAPSNSAKCWMIDYDDLKRAAYRMAWPQRTKQTPSGKTTWALWFAAKFGEDIESYHRKLYLEAHQKLNGG